MREYVLFVILIFIPIGLVLYYFLRREGLPKKDISIILMLALLIIFSFPICMERLGIYLSLLIYLLIIGALVAYLLRGGESPYLEMAFASLRNLRQRPELIINTEPDLTVLKYEQLSEMPLDKAQPVVGQALETVWAEAEIEVGPENPEPAVAIDMVEDLAGVSKVLSIETELAVVMDRGAGEETAVDAAQEKAEASAASTAAEKTLDESGGEVGGSLIQTGGEKHIPELAPDGLVDEMVARLAAKIEAMPESPAQVRSSEVIAEEQAELAVVVEIVKDVIAEAAVRVENVTVAEISSKAAVQDASETGEAPEPVVIESDTGVLTEEAGPAVDLEIADESVVQAEAASAEEIIEEIVANEPETLEVPEPVAVEAEPAVVTEETEAAADLEIAEDIADESVVQAEPAPFEEIIEEIVADEPETLEVTEPVAVEAEPAVATEETEAAAYLEIAEDIADESVVQAEAAPFEEIIEEIAADVSETLEVPESVVVQEDIETTAATGIEIDEETVSGAEDVQREVSFAGEVAEEEAVQALETVPDLSEPTQVVEDIEALAEETTETAGIPEAIAETAMLSEEISEESGPGEVSGEELLEPEAEIEEVYDLSASEEIGDQPDQPAAAEAADIPQETDIIEIGEASPGEAEEAADGLAEATLVTVEHGEVNRLVDTAFHYKTIGDIPAAIEAFVQVWNKVESDELRYLITLELVDLYKECGYYNYAEQVLGNYLELGGHKSDIIYEINRQLNAIRFLATELTRLGMSGAPWAQVPRWIRMELEDALNQ